jgi:hypothetical protein
MGDFIGNQPVPTVKGPRNYIQLSDGSTDLTFNLNVFVNSSGLIGNHITGDGTPTQLAFFDGSSSIASTPGASANVSSEQVEFSQTKGLRRLSSTFANSWEDGHLGNSSNIFFTPSDFTNYNFSTSTPANFSIGKRNTVNLFGGTMTAVGAGVTSNVIAIKILPKGFAVKVDTGKLIVSANLGISFGRIVVKEMDLGSASAPTLLMSGGPASLPSIGQEIDIDIDTQSSTGNGTIVILVELTTSAGVELTSAINLVGVSIPIIRV